MKFILLLRMFSPLNFCTRKNKSPMSPGVRFLVKIRSNGGKLIHQLELKLQIQEK